jgi:hypothetical protein
MFAILSVFAVVLASLLIIRVATVILTATGLSHESARFQARSALSGVGFTTSEAESVVNHPVRRRVIMALMLLGSGGIVTAVVTVVFSFAGAQEQEKLVRAVVLLTGLLIVLSLARSRWVDRRLTVLISRVLGRFTDLDVRDYASLLHLAGEYAVMELAVDAGDWVAGRSLTELELRDEGLVVLGIVRRDGDYLGVPTGSTVVHAGDTLILYGREPDLCELDQRRAGAAGDRAHVEAVAEQDEIEGQQRRLEVAEPL